MRLARVRVKGLSVAFRRELEVDFENLGAGLIALVGPNGTGKTTLLEACGPAVLYREFPSYGESLAAHVAPGVRAAAAELEFDLRGHRYLAVVQADPQFGGGRGKTEAYLYRDGEQVAGPLVRDYDAAIAEILPPKELFLASVFAAQGGHGSFFSLPKAARKDLFVRMLGIEHLQCLSQEARERHNGVLVDVAGLESEIAAAREAQARVAELEEKLGLLGPSRLEAEARLREAVAAHNAAREELAAARAEAARAEAAREHWRSERDRLVSRISDLRERIDTLEKERSRLERAAADEKAAELAAAKLECARSDLELLSKSRDHAQQLAADLRVRLTELDAELDARRGDAERVRQELERARDAERQAAACRVDEGDVERLRAAVEEEERRVEEAAREADRLSALADEEMKLISRRLVLEQRIRDLSGRARAISGVDVTHPMCAACPLTKDAMAAEAALAEAEAELSSLPEPSGAREALMEASAELEEARGRRDRLLAELSQAREALARAGAAREAASRVGALSEELEEVSAAVGRVRAAREEVARGVELARAEADRVSAEIDGVKARIAELERRASLLADARAARAALGRVDGDIEAACVEMAACERSLAELGDEPEVPRSVGLAEAAVAEAAAAEDEARRRLGKIEQEVARIEGELYAARAAAAGLDALTARLDVARRDAADWRLLETSLGRDGVQALEIAAAGPAVAALANDLLDACYGPRFQLALETLAPKKSGGTKEVFDVRIIDSEAGREAIRGSGGEMVILDEALRLALAIHNARRSGYELRTLYRDETTGALSPENADRYVAMLRRAMEIGGFERVLFVAHQEHVWRQADEVIRLG